MITALAFIATLGILIVIHEYGHYRVALACGVKVLRFSVGFGRVLWRRQATPDSTEFVLCLLPLGGYVKMLDEREGPVDARERNRSFNRKRLWQRAAIVSAGPIANLLLAVLLFAASHWIGVQEPKAVLGAPVPASLAQAAGMRSGDWVRASSSDGLDWHDLRSMVDLRWQVTQAVLHREALHLMLTDRDGHASRNVVLGLNALGTSDIDAQLMQRIGLGSPFSEPVLGEVKAGGAGMHAGLREGDRVLRIDGAEIADAASVGALIRASGSDGSVRTMQWRIERAGQVIDVPVMPAIAEAAGQKIGRLGVVLGRLPESVTVHYGVFEGLTQAASQTWDISALTLKMLGKMLIGEASLKNLSGPLTIADYAGQSVRQGPAYYLGFLAMVSVSLGILNLLPLPVLDGGHLMYYLFEAVTGRPVSERWLERLQRGGVAVMLMMMSLALYNDVARLLGLQ